MQNQQIFGLYIIRLHYPPPSTPITTPTTTIIYLWEREHDILSTVIKIIGMALMITEREREFDEIDKLRYVGLKWTLSTTHCTYTTYVTLLVEFSKFITLSLPWKQSHYWNIKQHMKKAMSTWIVNQCLYSIQDLELFIIQSAMMVNHIGYQLKFHKI